jgi:hypothetical protein
LAVEHPIAVLPGVALVVTIIALTHSRTDEPSK